VIAKSKDDLRDAAALTSFDRYRALLFSIAYRMLGSVADAEDMLQEAFIRWQQAARAEIRSPKAFLITIVSRLCINHLQSARVERETYFGEWLPEPVATDVQNDPLAIAKIDESLSIAFLVMLERLTPIERAVFLLHEVFSYRYAEIAVTVGQSEANCRQILRRARQHISAARRRFKASPQEHRKLVERFFQATRNDDADGLMAMLARDVVLHSDGGGRANAVPKSVVGADRVARGIIGGLRKFVPRELTTEIRQINGHPSLVSFLAGVPYSVVTFEVDGGRITAIYVLTNAEKLRHLRELSALAP
jgi:RNA polymerase sigma-70 factor (ECF subfamily)